MKRHLKKLNTDIKSLSGIAEIDQSGKIEFTSENTVLALSNKAHFTVLIPTNVKRELYKELRNKYHSEKMITLKIFSAALYFLLKHHISSTSIFHIDQEYQGHEADIKANILSLLNKTKVRINKHQIHFVKVGKRSPSHILALNTLRKKKKPDLVLGMEEILRKIIEKHK